MVVFDLICLNGHLFEGWFANLSDFEAQMADGRLNCPICGEENVTRRPSTFGLVRRRAESPREGQPGAGNPSLGQNSFPEADQRADQRMDPQMGSKNMNLIQQAANLLAFRTLSALTERLEKDFVDVGAGFATEALKMRYGAAPSRNIRGYSTADEEETLKNEGIEFFKLPMLNRKKSVS
ncbi:MAG: DUF1178 family protein [Deltaproteobacteria bacterium]|jgi:hypothetical protein|nr:DUF1178 family protein [Deltaproteobacteria bacterium]